MIRLSLPKSFVNTSVSRISAVGHRPGLSKSSLLIFAAYPAFKTQTGFSLFGLNQQIGRSFEFLGIGAVKIITVSSVNLLNMRCQGEK